MLDPAVIYKHKSGNLLKICAAFVDNILHAGNASYATMSEKTEKRLYCE